MYCVQCFQACQNFLGNTEANAVIISSASYSPVESKSQLSKPKKGLVQHHNYACYM